MMDRQVAFRPQRPPPLTLGLIIALVVLWIGFALAVRTGPGAALFSALVMNPNGILEGRLWTLVTSSFLHPPNTPFAVLLNALLLYFFAPELEQRWGNKRWLLFVVLTAFFGGLTTFALSFLGLNVTGFAGATAIATGFLTAWALTFPQREILAFFVLPMKAIHLLYLELLIVGLGFISTGPTSGSSLGGIATAAVLTLGLFRRNTMVLAWDWLLVKLRIKKQPKLTLVPPPKKKDGSDYIH